jgi:cytochrome d ubiquinol oxidase subunit II
METFWYIAVTVMLAVYVVLDGFDFGVGIVYPMIARDEADRRAALTTIGPVWTANEVWLIAAGGLLFFAFPKVYAAGFSGFYLALIIVLWLLIARGLAIELRSHLDHPLWRTFWDLAFTGSSTLLALVFGTALGNLIRGVPLNQDGYFFVALWTDLTTGPDPGILDWFTILMGLASVAILAMHGANYLAVKTAGELQRRARWAAWLGGFAAAGLVVGALVSLPFVQPLFHTNYAAHPIGYLFPFTGLAALGATIECRRRNLDAAAFAASSLFILAMLASTAWGSYPNLLIATPDPAYSLTIFNGATDGYGLQVGFWWFLVGLGLIVVYQVTVHRAFRGKVQS